MRYTIFGHMCSGLSLLIAYVTLHATMVQGLTIDPSRDVIVCPENDEQVTVTCTTTTSRTVRWMYRSRVKTSVINSPDVTQVAVLISHDGATIAFVTNANITETNVVSEMHLHLYSYLLPITVTCAAEAKIFSTRFLPVDNSIQPTNITVARYTPFPDHYEALIIWSIRNPLPLVHNGKLVLRSGVTPQRFPAGKTPTSNSTQFFGHFLYNVSYDFMVHMEVCGMRSTETSLVLNPLKLRLSNNQSFYLNGSQVDVTCVSSHPFPQLQTEWLDTKGMPTGNGNRLEFIAYPQHAGNYRCQYKTIRSSTSVVFKVNVHYKPSLKIEVARAGDFLDLTCTIDSSPLPNTIEWIFNSQTINKKNFPVKLISSTIFNLSSTVTNSILEWRPADGEEVTCKAKNRFGETTVMQELEVSNSFISTRLIPIVAVVACLLLLALLSAVSTYGLVYILKKKRRREKFLESITEPPPPDTPGTGTPTTAESQIEQRLINDSRPVNASQPVIPMHQRQTTMIAVSSAPASVIGGHRPGHGSRRHMRDHSGRRYPEGIPWWEKQVSRMAESKLASEPGDLDNARFSVSGTEAPYLQDGKLTKTMSHPKMAELMMSKIHGEHPGQSSMVTTELHASKPVRYAESMRGSSDSSEGDENQYINQALMDKVKATEDMKVPWVKTSSVDVFTKKSIGLETEDKKSETGVGASTSDPVLEDEILYMNTKTIREKYLDSNNSLYKNVDGDGNPMPPEEEEQNEGMDY